MHATAVLLLIDQHDRLAVWGHVGDTRIYLFRRGRVAFQTRDHSLVQNMIDAGYGSVDMIRTHPQRSLLTSAIGSSEAISLSVSAEPMARLLDVIRHELGLTGTKEGCGEGEAGEGEREQELHAGQHTPRRGSLNSPAARLACEPAGAERPMNSCVEAWVRVASRPAMRT